MALGRDRRAVAGVDVDPSPGERRLGGDLDPHDLEEALVSAIERREDHRPLDRAALDLTVAAIAEPPLRRGAGGLRRDRRIAELDVADRDRLRGDHHQAVALEAERELTADDLATAVGLAIADAPHPARHGLAQENKVGRGRPRGEHVDVIAEQRSGEALGRRRRLADARGRRPRAPDPEGRAGQRAPQRACHAELLFERGPARARGRVVPDGRGAQRGHGPVAGQLETAVAEARCQRCRRCRRSGRGERERREPAQRGQGEETKATTEASR